MTQRSFDDFDNFASDYRNIHTENVKISGADSFYFAKMKVELLKQFEKNSPLQLLDLGCGDGVTEVYVHQNFSEWIVSGIDISEKSISVASQRKIPHTLFKTFDGQSIPFKEDSFDVVFIAGVLHHVAFQFHAQIVREIGRVLKKGGRLYLFEHNPLNPLTKYLVNTCVFDKDAKLLKSGYASAILKKNGLTVNKKKFIIFFPRKGILSKFIFLEKYLQWLPLGGQYLIAASK